MSFVEMLGVLMPTEIAVSVVLEIDLAAVFAAALPLAVVHRGFYHHWLMLSGFLADELVAKPIMVMRFMDGVLGDYPYSATSGLGHIILSVIATVSGVVTIALGLKFRTKKKRKMFLPPKGKRLHMVSGVMFFVSWFLTFALGMRIFLMFYV